MILDFLGMYAPYVGPAVAGLVVGYALRGGTREKVVAKGIPLPLAHTHDLFPFTTEQTNGYSRTLYRCRLNGCDYQQWTSKKD